MFAGRKPANRPVGIRETFFSAHYVQKTVWVFSGNLYTPGMSSEHADAQIAPQAPVPAGGNGADNGRRTFRPRRWGCAWAPVRTPLGVLLGGAAVVLALMVGLLAFISIDRSEAAMARLLAEKGSSLIMAFEMHFAFGHAQRGRRAPAGSAGRDGCQPDILFVAVTMPDGTIVAHSKRARLGEILELEGRELDDVRMHELAPGMPAHWGIMNMEGQRVFVVYRYFTPGLRDMPRVFPLPIIFLGLDVSPFEITRSQNRDYVAMLAAVTLLVGLACLLALYYAQRARESRQRQHRAEGEVRRLEEEVRAQGKTGGRGQSGRGRGA